MFNLIAAVLSIALIGLTAGASIYYGGSAFTGSTARADAALLINAANQISGAQNMHMIDRGNTRNAQTELLTRCAADGTLDPTAATACPADGANAGLINRRYLSATPGMPDALTPLSGANAGPATARRWRLYDNGQIAGLRLTDDITQTGTTDPVARSLCAAIAETADTDGNLFLGGPDAPINLTAAEFTLAATTTGDETYACLFNWIADDPAATGVFFMYRL